ncbi:hypothetical protein Tco_1119739 [Tanacetum coccineum]
MWLRYQVNGSNEGILHSYEQRLEMIQGRPVKCVHMLDFVGLRDGMRQTLGDRLSLVYDGEALFTSHVWRRLFEVRAPLVREFMLEFFSTCRMSDIEMGLDVADTLCFQLGGARRRMTWRQFIQSLGLHSEEEMAEPGFGAYWSSSERVIPDKGILKIIGWRSRPIGTSWGPLPPMFTSETLHAEGRKGGTRLSEGHFIGCLAAHFGLVGDQGLRGLSVVVSELPAAAAGASGAAEDAPVADEGAQAVPAPVQAPQPPPPAP